MNPVFLLDENVRGVLSVAIRVHNERGENPIDFMRVGDIEDLPLGSLDPDILDWAERNGRILVTGDRATMLSYFLARLNSGHHSSGVLLVRDGFGLPVIVEHLASISWASEHWEYFDRFEHIS